MQTDLPFILKSKKNKSALLFLLPSLMGVAVFALLPFGDVVLRAPSGFPELAGNKAFLLAGKNTLRFTFLCIPLLLMLSFLTAVLLRRIRNTYFIKTSFLLPYLVPAFVPAFLWKLSFSENNLLNSPGVFYVLVGSYIWKNLGYTVILWLAGMSALPEEQEEAARVDGAGNMRILWSVILPNLKPTCYTITVISLVNSLKVFREAYMVAGTYPHESIYMIPHLFQNWFQNLEIEKLSAASVLLFFLLMIPVLLLRNIWGVEEG